MGTESPEGPTNTPVDDELPVDEQELMSKWGITLYGVGLFMVFGISIISGLVLVDQIDHNLIANTPFVGPLVESTYSAWSYIKSLFVTVNNELPGEVEEVIESPTIRSIKDPTIPKSEFDHYFKEFPEAISRSSSGSSSSGSSTVRMN
jgi:hypothetical protein